MMGNASKRVGELVSGATIVLMPVMRTIMISLITFHRLLATVMNGNSAGQG